MITVADTPLVDQLHPAANIEPRRVPGPPTILLLHYTGLISCQKAIDWLSRPESKVSCHYVVDSDGTITQMVSEGLRAWHAGEGSWEGQDDVNSRSIGIEIHNPGHDRGYPDFPDAQMDAVITLSADIVARNGIEPWRVLAHSDIAPVRKIDPGEKFDWRRLAEAGVGLWVEPEPLGPLIGDVSTRPDPELVAYVERLLAEYGYGVTPTGTFDAGLRTVMRAFQRHFRPARVDGLLDHSSVATLERLVAAKRARLTS
ncbi:MAG: N-acetylmuramoyl-L-alanine amidase [Hyphomicrobiaceae bacterium]|nr:N-acetylmuramoyl-L-alanine amidase [Hyphomicrobiaceae bacterium]